MSTLNTKLLLTTIAWFVFAQVNASMVCASINPDTPVNYTTENSVNANFPQPPSQCSNVGIKIPQNIRAHNIYTSSIKRSDFSSITRWYTEDGDVQRFQLHNGDTNKKKNTSVRRPRLETFSPRWKRGNGREWHEFSANYYLDSWKVGQRYAIFQIKTNDASNFIIQGLIDKDGTLEIARRSRGNYKIDKNVYRKPFHFRVRSNGFKFEVYYNCKLVLAENHPQPNLENKNTEYGFRWGLYRQKTSDDKQIGTTTMFVTGASVDPDNSSNTPTTTPTPRPVSNTKVDKINSVTKPRSVKQGQNVSISVNYEASTKRDIVTVFQIDSAPWTEYREIRTTVNAGKGTKKINIAIPSNVPVAKDRYQIQVFIAPQRGNWKDRLDSESNKNIDVTRGGSTTPSPTTNPSSTNTCSFGTPSKTGLQSFDRASFTNIYVLGNSSFKTSNIRRFRINWDAKSKRLHQFAFNTANGSPSYYVDLLGKIKYNFTNSKPEITISKSGLSGLDGAYYVTKDGANFVMVSKDRNFTIYLSNGNKPKCNATSSKGVLNAKVSALNLYPNPASNVITLSGLSADGANVSVISTQGRIIYKQTMLAGENNVNISPLDNGVYFLLIEQNNNKNTIPFIKQ